MNVADLTERELKLLAVSEAQSALIEKLEDILFEPPPKAQKEERAEGPSPPNGEAVTMFGPRVIDGPLILYSSYAAAFNNHPEVARYEVLDRGMAYRTGRPFDSGRLV
jgi:hypothetical protein